MFDFFSPQNYVAHYWRQGSVRGGVTVTSRNGGRALGVRADAGTVYWAVVEMVDDKLVVVGREDMTLPQSFTDPEGFAWVRDKIQGLIQEFSVGVAGVRTPEGMAQGRGEGVRRRLRIEGVVMEAASAKGLQVHSGTLGTIASRLGLETAKSAKEYQEKGGSLRGLNLKDLSKPLRECVLIAAAALAQHSRS